MQLIPLTRASLLVRIQDPHDAEAWRQFFDLYASVIYGFAHGAAYKMPTPPI